MDDFLQYFQDGSPLEPYLRLLGRYGVLLYDRGDLILMYLHLIVSAIFPIYIGSHASLRCPPSAKLEKHDTTDNEDDLGKDAEPVIEGLTPSDAILFPIGAGITLGGLYLLIKWLNDPSILNRILNWYFSGIGVFGVGKLAADGLNVATTFVFPSVWSTTTTTYHVDPLLSSQVTGQNPLAGPLSDINLGSRVSKLLWAARGLLKSHWILRTYIHNVCSFTLPISINDITGLVIGILSIVLYNTIGREWWLSNLIAFGFCYGTLQLMSPTTFWTGTLVLAGLFVYDITMVFYTPMMITVATSLDVPIKLVFPGPKRGSMLGLGDVVLPGIMMALALRFDLYLHYLRKSSQSPSASKVEYVDATGVWGEIFWTRPSKEEETVADAARFEKTYFKASVVGYVLGMIVTLVVMNIWNHAQPALLYLVPGVLGSLWGTALLRGEVGKMWEYTEDGVWGFDDKKVEKKEEDGSGEAAKGQKEDSVKSVIEKTKEGEKTRNAEHIFLFSLSAPRKVVKKALAFEKQV